MSGHLCLKWNNHSSAFLKSINNIHIKERYCDATLACQGKFFPVHRFILSTCSDYFDEIFERMQCPHPYIIFKDIDPREMELLLNYMYQGEVNVVQERLPTLIKAAEALRIKGLAVPDDMPSGKESSCKKRSAITCGDAPLSKRRLEERRRKGESFEYSSRAETGGGVQSSGDPSTSSSRRSEDEPKVIKQEPLDPPCDDFVGDEPPPMIKTEFDAGEPLGEESESMGKEENVFHYPGSDDPGTFSKTDEAIPSEDHFDDEQSSSWGDYASGSMMQGLPPSEMSLQDDMVESSRGRCQQPAFDHTRGWIRMGSKQLSPLGTREIGDAASLPQTSSSVDVQGQLKPVTPRRCPFCPYRSNYRANVKRHIMFKHTREKPFRCAVCAKRFTLKETLLIHMRIHTGEKPYECHKCSKKFSQIGSLKTHVQSKFGCLKR